MKKKITSSLAFLLLFSCAKSEAVADDIVENAESKISSSRYSKGQNMIDAIYYELIKNDENLKNLDKKILLLQRESHEVEDIYEDIQKKSSEYYADAENVAKSVNDSILKKELLKILKNSSNNNFLKEKKYRELTKQINDNRQTIYCHYSAFKIKKTLPEIEKYQNSHPLKTDSLENFVNKQNKLLSKLKNLK
ncbi:hypothetical protein D1632_11440 [Chryseobacterium nematophagum]|uniref:Lipoprotein n=1 Tax=Chryseobacterium nematophagum TaxID=2305228 RepID=A0A3M7L6N0_9FLAO|nr:hypothetical protein [Chryseobacterium nematophagum]RMZ58237.1 hypothetical protein D1632_11440 [Chryseobacterium nematophagum]